MARTESRRDVPNAQAGFNHRGIRFSSCSSSSSSRPNHVSHGKRKTSLGSSMWDSFESDSLSEEEEHVDEKQQEGAGGTKGSSEATSDEEITENQQQHSRFHSRVERGGNTPQGKVVVVGVAGSQKSCSLDTDPARAHSTSCPDSRLASRTCGIADKNSSSDRSACGEINRYCEERCDVAHTIDIIEDHRVTCDSPEENGNPEPPRHYRSSQRRLSREGSARELHMQSEHQGGSEDRVSSSLAIQLRGKSSPLGSGEGRELRGRASSSSSKYIAALPTPLDADVEPSKPLSGAVESPDTLINPSQHVQSPSKAMANRERGVRGGNWSTKRGQPMNTTAGKAHELFKNAKAIFGRKDEGQSGRIGKRQRSRVRWSKPHEDTAGSYDHPRESDAGDEVDSKSKSAVVNGVTLDNDETAVVSQASVACVHEFAVENNRGIEADGLNTENKWATSRYATSLRQVFTKGERSQRSDARRGPDHKAQVDASRSSGLAINLRRSLRGVIMGRAMLEAHSPNTNKKLITHVLQPDREHCHNKWFAGDEEEKKRERKRDGNERRRSRGCRNTENKRLDPWNPDEVKEDDESSSAGILDGKRSPHSSIDSADNIRDLKNLPEAVQSYIDARARMEREMSASGPYFIPRLGNQTLDYTHIVESRCKRRGSLDISKQTSSTTQLSEQHLPFTEAMFKSGVSETQHSTKQGILLEGDLQKFSPESVRGVRWHKRYFVLYGSTCELRYYRTHVDAAWGRIPLGERGSIPLRLVVKIKQPSDKKYRGCRFDLVVLHKGEGRHPGLLIPPDGESDVVTTKTFKLNTANAQQRLLWVTVIEALMNSHGWGSIAQRRRRERAPEHGKLSNRITSTSNDTRSAAAAAMTYGINSLEYGGNVVSYQESPQIRGEQDGALRARNQADIPPV